MFGEHSGRPLLVPSFGHPRSIGCLFNNHLTGKGAERLTRRRHGVSTDGGDGCCARRSTRNLGPMTMSPVELEPKVRQLDNDVQSIYELLNSISSTQQRHTNRLGELAVKVDAIDAKLDDVLQLLRGNVSS